MLEFLRETVYGLPVSRDGARVAMATFADDAHVMFQLNSYTSRTAVLNAIAVPRGTGGTDLARALRLARRRIFTPGSGDRAGVPNAVVVVTDGGSDAAALRAAAAEVRQLGASGTRVHLVAVGGQVGVGELDRLADVYHVQGDEDLASQSDLLLRRLCA